MVYNIRDQGKAQYKVIVANDLAMAYLQQALISKKAVICLTKEIAVGYPNG